MEEGRDTIDIFRGSLSSIPSSLFCLCVGLFYPSTPLPPPLPLRGNEIVPESWPAPFGIIHDAVAISRAGIVYLAGAGEVGGGGVYRSKIDPRRRINAAAVSIFLSMKSARCDQSFPPFSFDNSRQILLITNYYVVRPDVILTCFAFFVDIRVQ